MLVRLLCWRFILLCVLLLALHPSVQHVIIQFIYKAAWIHVMESYSVVSVQLSLPLLRPSAQFRPVPETQGKCTLSSCCTVHILIVFWSLCGDLPWGQPWLAFRGCWREGVPPVNLRGYFLKYCFLKLDCLQAMASPEK